jgi:hypothetical protein
MNDDLTREDVAQRADRIVDDLLTAAGVTQPPVDALAVARHLGMTIREEEANESQGRPRRKAAAGVLVIARDGSEECRQWTAAQAVGERLKPDLMRRLGLDPAAPRAFSGESFADMIARRLLTPTAWFSHDARAAGWDVPEVQRLYTTASLELTAWRLLDLTEPCIITLIESDHIQRRRSNAWRVNKTLQPAERECQRYVHVFSRPRTVAADGWTVQGWPLHKPDWKREILRSVVEAE